jgi:hypothetical protein
MIRLGAKRPSPEMTIQLVFQTSPDPKAGCNLMPCDVTNFIFEFQPSPDPKVVLGYKDPLY